MAVKNISFLTESKVEMRLCLLTLTDVMYSSDLRNSLISSPQLDKLEAYFCGGNGEVTPLLCDEGYFKIFYLRLI